MKKRNILVLLSIEKHIIVGRNDETNVTEETVASAVNELQDILHTAALDNMPAVQLTKQTRSHKISVNRVHFM